MELEFRKYQKGMYRHGIENPVIALFAEMGLGKTAVVWALIRYWMHTDLSIRKTLIIAPKKVAASVWTDERDKWNDFKYMTTSIVMGSVKERLQALQKKADVYIINVDNVAWLVDLYLTRWPFDMLVVDESSKFKSPSSNRFKKLSMILPYPDRKIIMSGTPAPEGMHDLWSQIFILDQGERLGETITSFRNEYLKPDKVSQFGVSKWGSTEANDKRILERIEDIAISLKAEDYITLPPIMFQDHKVKLSDKNRQLYDQFERDQVIEFFETHEERQITAVNMAVLTNKLIQFAGGSIYDEDRNTINIHSEKLDLVEELIELANGEPVLIGYMYIHQLQRMQKRFKGKVFKEGDEKAWNKGDIPLMYIHPKSGAHGLNLQFGGCFLIMYSPTWSSEEWSQLPKRLHRPGQLKPVMVHRILTVATMDIDCVRSVESKQKKELGMMQALKWRYNKYKKQI